MSDHAWDVLGSIAGGLGAMFLLGLFIPYPWLMLAALIDARMERSQTMAEAALTEAKASLLRAEAATHPKTEDRHDGR